MKRLAALCIVVLVVTGCNSVPFPQDRKTFLRTNDPNWSMWFDTVIYVNLSGTRFPEFKFVKGLGFGRTPLLLRGPAPQYEPIIIQGYGRTIREFLWGIHRKYGFVFDLHRFEGKLHLRVRSPKAAQLTEPN